MAAVSPSYAAMTGIEREFNMRIRFLGETGINDRDRSRLLLAPPFSRAYPWLIIFHSLISFGPCSSPDPRRATTVSRRGLRRS